jgi:arylsulfatase A-like enzyme/Flp pilus assembly protein TadD
MALLKKALGTAAVLFLATFARAAGPNVLLVTIDTLRADRLGCYAAVRAPTPAIDALAARGVLFERAFAHNPTTLPSHANILSGLTPLAHGVSENAKSKFPPDLPTLAVDLKARGYATGAFIGAFPLDSRFGLDRGFDVYDDAIPSRPAPGGARGERRAAEVIEAAAAWIGGRTGAWFCWVHLWDPHAPYAPPEPYLGKYRDDPYAGEVAYVDSQLAVLFDRLERGGISAGTIIVLTADHGEGLGEHGELTHSYFAYNSTLHVPLIIAGPGLKPRRVTANVGHIDILPTICDLLGLKPRAALQGRSLATLMRTGRDKDRPLYFESLEPYFDLGCAPLRGFIQGRTKFIDSPIPEVYDLAADPGETKNLAAAGDLGPLRKELERLKEELSSASAGSGARVADAQTLERLRSLGYAASPAAQPKASYGPDDDVKSVLPFQQRLEQAILRTDGGQAEDGLRELAALVRDKKDFTPAYVYLAQTLASLGRIDEAVRALEDGVRDNPGNYALLSTLGTVLLMARQNDRAQAVWEKAVAVIGFDPDAWNNLGGIFLNRFFAGGRAPEDLARAVEHFRRALSLDPALSPALRGLAAASMAGGDIDGAIAAWEKAVAADPADGPSLYSLGLAYLKTGDKARALRAFEAYLELTKGSLPPEQKDRVLDLISRCRKAPGPAAGTR